MKLTQLSIFLENRPGRLAEACGELAKAGVNIEATSLIEAGDFGVLRFLVKNPNAAFDALKDRFTVRKSDVLAIQVPDEAGALAKLLGIVSKSETLNVEYMYGFTSKKLGVAALVFAFNDVDLAASTLKAAGVSFVGAEELFG